jgi:hypothetical protein
MNKSALAALLLIVLAGSGCRSIAPLPGASEVADWQKDYRALDCWNPRTLYVMPSTDPLLFAMTRICLKVPGKAEPGQGYQTLVAIDAARNEVRAVRIASVYSGGIHYTRDGDLIWYSSGNTGEATISQRHVEAFTLRKGQTREASLGRIEVPFITGPGVASLRGDECNLVSVANYRKDGDTPVLSAHFLASDTAPFTEALPLEGPIVPLFWNPAGRYFVVQRASRMKVPPLPAVLPERFAVDCSGAQVAIDAQLQARLAQVHDHQTRFWMSSRGDLLAWSSAHGANGIHVFRGDARDLIRAPETMAFCPDGGCDPIALPVNPVEWSKSGEHFMVEVGFDHVRVYRTADLEIVAGWTVKAPEDFPAVGFLSDSAAFEFQDHSRIHFHEWSAATIQRHE